MDGESLRTQIRTASLSLLVGAIAAVAVAVTTPTPVRGFLLAPTIVRQFGDGETE